MINQGRRNTSSSTTPTVWKISEEGVITATPTTLSTLANVYNFRVDTSGGDVDISDLSTWAAGGIIDNPTIVLEKGTEFVFINISSTGKLKYSNYGVDVVLRKGDSISLFYTGVVLPGSTIPYILRSAIQSNGKKKTETIQALASNQLNYTLTDQPNEAESIEVYAGGGHRLFYGTGFSIAGKILSLIHNEYRVDMNETIRVVYYI